MTARVGIPEEVLTDNASNFVSKTMREYCTTMGIEHFPLPSPDRRSGRKVQCHTQKVVTQAYTKRQRLMGRMPSLRVVGIQRNCAQNHRVLTLPDVIWQTYENAHRPDGQVLEGEGRTRTK